MKIKVCGMKYASNIAAVAELNPDYLGFIFYPKSPRAINEITTELIKYVPQSIKTVGVFVNEEVETVIAKVLQHQLKAVQLHGSESVAYCLQLKNQGIEIIKAFGIDDNFDFNQLTDYETVVDYFLFDTQSPQHGGTGKTFDWTLLEKYTLQKSYFLSGGIDLIHLENVKKINDPRCWAIDVNSKFEIEPGLKDLDKLKQLVTEIRN